MSRGTLSAVAVAVSLACLSLSGCTVMNSESTPEAHCTSNTVGKELSDLKTHITKLSRDIDLVVKEIDAEEHEFQRERASLLRDLDIVRREARRGVARS